MTLAFFRRRPKPARDARPSSSLVPPREDDGGPFFTRIRRALRSELVSLHPRLWLADLPARLLPPLAFPRLRTSLYRLAGISVGPHTLLAGRLELIGPGPIRGRLTIGRDCWLNAPFFADLTSSITIGDRVTIGHHVVLITASHTFGPAARRAGPTKSAPIVIGDGVWIAAGVTILPGVSIGAGSIIGAGSVVTRDIPERTLAFGTPARPVRQLNEDEDAEAFDLFEWADEEPELSPAPATSH
jgi:acetyltransferase-like isoleucine patch superfamily enzyme